jgi:hypothetical protein
MLLRWRGKQVDRVPDNDRCVEDVHNPDQFSHAHRDRYRNQLADQHAAKSSESHGQMGDQRVYLEGAHAKCDHGRNQIKGLKANESPAGIEYSPKSGFPG